jgi:hypothetical protein
LLPKKVNTAPSTPLHKTFFIQTSQRQNKNQKILAKNKVSCIERNSKCTFLKRWIKGLKIKIKQLLNPGNYNILQKIIPDPRALTKKKQS